MMGQPRQQLVAAIDDLLRGIIEQVTSRQPPPHGHDLTFAQFRCLQTITHLGSPRMSELSAELDLHPSTVTGFVDRLLKLGLVQRAEDPDDRRVVRVEISDKGRRDHDRHLRVMRAHLGELMVDLSDRDLARIREALSLMHAAVARREALDGPGARAGRDDDETG